MIVLFLSFLATYLLYALKVEMEHLKNVLRGDSMLLYHSEYKFLIKSTIKGLKISTLNK